MQYRKEIDGLRALAVLPVVLFHAGIERFEGGFVGVDIFFVISGYLITGIILAEHQAGSFSFRSFYERRIRRILPALSVVLLASTVGSFFILPFLLFKEFGLSLITVPLFSSNILFWKTSGYFNTQAHVNPLLHTWSLGVEEQYYLLYPLLLIWLLLFTSKRAAWWFLTGLALVSFWLGWQRLQVAPFEAFFLTHLRLWELLAGGLLAWFAHKHVGIQGDTLPRWRVALNTVLAAIGLWLIGYAVIRFDDQTQFPGVNALIPVVGAMLIIACATHRNWVARLLSWQPLVFVGLVSYSFYLWHQPIYALMFMSFQRHLLLPEVLGGALLAFGLAWLSWRFVERPFRNRNWISQRWVFAGAALVSLFFIGLGDMIYATDGLKNRVPAKQREIMAWEEYDLQASKLYLEKTCFMGSDQGYDEIQPHCYAALKQPQPVLLWGDSHAASLYQGIKQVVGNRPFAYITASGCPPLKGTVSKNRPFCAGIDEYVLREISKADRPTVLLMASWTESMELPDVRQLVDTIRTIRLSGGEVIILGSLVHWRPSLPQQLARQYTTDFKPGLTLDTPLLSDMSAHDKALRRVAKQENVPFISIIDKLCQAQQCLGLVQKADGKPGEVAPVAWDHSHLTLEGSGYIAEQLKDELLPLLPPAR